MSALLPTSDSFVHEIVSYGSSMKGRYFYDFSVVWQDGFLRARIVDLFKDNANEYVAWVPEHCPSAVWLYENDAISLVIPVPQEALEYKVRWV